jgi:hypothetical protein
MFQAYRGDKKNSLTDPSHPFPFLTTPFRGKSGFIIN